MNLFISSFLYFKCRLFGLRLKILEIEILINLCENSWETGLVMSDFFTSESYLIFFPGSVDFMVKQCLLKFQKTDFVGST